MGSSSQDEVYTQTLLRSAIDNLRKTVSFAVAEKLTAKSSVLAMQEENSKLISFLALMFLFVLISHSMAKNNTHSLISIKKKKERKKKLVSFSFLIVRSCLGLVGS